MKRDARIDASIERKQPFARPILSHIRDRVHTAVPEAEETLKWGAPAFTVDGKILLIMGAFKEHAVLNFWRGQELRGEDAKAEGMGQFGKLTSVADLPPDAHLEQLIRDAAELAKTAPAPRQLKHTPAAMHPEFARALDTAPEAKANFDAFTPGCRREYVDWIADAKREDTRAKRIATALEWLSEGKKRHWKYEKC